MREKTRERILQAGATIMHRKGFQGTGLKEVLEAAGAPKGSFYHFFPSKEAFGLALIDHFEERLMDQVRPVLAEEGLSPLDRFRAFVARFRAFFDANGCALGCPIGNLAQEMSDLSPVFQERLQVSFDRQAAFFSRLVLAGQAAGEVDPGLEAEATAQFLLAGWQGALLRMKVTRELTPLDRFEAFALRLLRPACAGATPAAPGALAPKTGDDRATR